LFPRASHLDGSCLRSQSKMLNAETQRTLRAAKEEPFSAFLRALCVSAFSRVV
jgi:hypothetical protein